MASEKDNSGNGSGAAPETPKGKPSDKQMNLLAIIMQNTEEQPKVNWENVASQASLKNDRVAKEMYRQMCKKFGWGNKAAATPGTPAATDTPSKTPKAARGSGSRVTKSTGKVGSAARKQLPRGRKPASALAADGEDDQERGESEVKEEVADAADPFISGEV